MKLLSDEFDWDAYNYGDTDICIEDEWCWGCAFELLDEVRERGRLTVVKGRPAYDPAIDYGGVFANRADLVPVHSAA